MAYQREYKAFTRAQAIGMLTEGDDTGTNYAVMDNETLECQLCLAGVIDDADMQGVFNTEKEAIRAVYNARVLR